MRTVTTHQIPAVVGVVRIEGVRNGSMAVAVAPGPEPGTLTATLVQRCTWAAGSLDLLVVAEGEEYHDDWIYVGSVGDLHLLRPS